MNFNFLDSGNIIYTLYFFILLIFVITRYNYSNKQNKNIFIIFVFIQLFLGSFRMEGVGTDTFAYVRYMNYNYSLSYNEVYNEWVHNDPVFYILVKFLYDPFQSYTIVFAFLQIAFWIPLGITMYKYSDRCLLALLVFVLLKYHFNVWSAIRQGFALSFIICSYSYLIHEKKKSFFLCIALATLAHSSALLFLMAYPLRNICLYEKKRVLLGAVVMAFLVMPFLQDLNLFSAERLNKGSASNLFILLTTIISFIFIYIKFNTQSNKNNNLLFNLSFVALLMAILGFKVTLGYRVLIYFGFFISMLVSNVVYSNRWLVQRVFFQLLLPMALIYILTGIPASVDKYYFFWEQNVFIDPDKKL